MSGIDAGDSIAFCLRKYAHKCIGLGNANHTTAGSGNSTDIGRIGFTFVGTFL